MKLESASAIVSGGASGLGLATARKVIEAGGSAVLLDINEDQGARSAKELGPRAHFVKADISSEEAVRAAVRQAAEFMGSLTLAVNCAGVLLPSRVLGREGPMAAADFARSLTINLLGTFILIKEAASLMQDNEADAEGERGVIVNTASVAAYEGQIGQVPYSASKGGIVGMNLPIARDLADSLIRCVTVAPGIFDTPLLGELPEDVRASLGASVPHPARLGEPREYAGLVVHIVESQMLNGEVIRLDGALRMAPR